VFPYVFICLLFLLRPPAIAEGAFWDCITDAILTQELYACTVDVSREVAAYVLFATFCSFAACAAFVLVAPYPPFGNGMEF
jgi:hypothetical protein